MKNYQNLLKKISKWMKEDTLLFVNHFCHKTFAYHFEVLPWLDFLHIFVLCLEKNFVHQSLIYGNFDVSCPSIWLRTQMMMIGLQNTSSPVEQCLQLIYFFISRSVLYPFFSFFWTCDTSVLSTSSNKFMYRTMFLLLITGLWMESIMHKPGS